MKVNYNVSAMTANNALQRTDNALTQSLERLSSGLKIPSAKDDPAGLAISRRMNAQLTGLSSAKDNSGDGISVVQTADGVLGEVTNILQRMSELSIQAANGTLSQADRSTIQDEIVQLKEEITRITASTQFNGQNLLDGTFDLQGYATVDGVTDREVTVNTYSDQVPAGEVTIEGLTVAYDEDKNEILRASVGSVTDSKGNTYQLDTQADGTPSSNDDILRFYNEDGMSFEIRVGKDMDGSSQVKLDLTGKGAMTMQVGANENQTLDIRIPAVGLSNLGITNLDVTLSYQDELARMEKNRDAAGAGSEEYNLWVDEIAKLRERAGVKVDHDGTEYFTKPHIGADDAIETIKGALAYVTAVRSRLGAYQNRMEHTVKNLDVTSENMTSAYSRIMDVDMAEEMTTYTTQQVLSQAGVSMLAQANERPSEVLQLLQ